MFQLRGAAIYVTQTYWIMYAQVNHLHPSARKQSKGGLQMILSVMRCIHGADDKTPTLSKGSVGTTRNP
jgi:hypothetical protein